MRAALSVDLVSPPCRAVAPPLLLVATATLALGALFGLIEAAQVHWRDAFTMRPSSWETALRIAMPPWLLYGLLAPGAFLLAERFRLDRRSRWSAALAHVLGAALGSLQLPREQYWKEMRIALPPTGHFDRRADVTQVGVIADDKEIESLAGIMGGDSTAVTLDTTDIYLEAAFWWPAAI